MNNVSRRDFLNTFAGLTGAAFISGCAINPVTGKRELMLMTEGQEIELGKQGHEDIIKTYGIYNDPKLQNWVSSRGMEIAKITQRPRLPYTFTVLDSPVVNAFAVPGGYLYITRGILAYFNNEAQFAGVLAHELGHVNARHSASQYSKAQLANLALGIGSIFSEEFEKYSAFASIGMSMMFLKYSRDDEREADKLGVEYSSAVGYDAEEMSAFFFTLDRLNPSGGSLPSWFSTHPNPGERVKTTRNLSLQYQKTHPGISYTKKRDEYFAVIDGIVFGDDPRQGYVKGNTFYHPLMKFMFPFPDGWKLTNSPAEIRIAPEGNNSVFVFNSAEAANAQNAALNFAQNNKVEVIENNSTKINGMNTVLTKGKFPNTTDTTIMSCFIEKDKSIFAFHGLFPTAEETKYSPNFVNMINGFRPISDKSLENVSPEKIEIRQVPKSGTFKDAFNSLGISKDKLDELAILNGVELGSQAEKGVKLKIVD